MQLPASRDAAAGPSTATRSHVPSLDGVRGLAIAIVLVHNATFILHGSHASLPKVAVAAAAAGWLGVQLFFVLSGFLITGILLDARTRPQFFRTFYARRTLRIFPLYYAFLVAALFIVPLVVQVADWHATAWRNQIFYWTYTSNWGNPFGYEIAGLSHFWSLAVEEQFYLFWPVIVFLGSPRFLLRLCAGLIAVTPLVRLGLRLSGYAPLAGYEFTIARWDALAAGALLAICLRDDQVRALLPRYLKAITIAAGAVLIAFVVRERGFHENDLRVQVVGQTLVSVLGTALIFACVGTAASSSTAGIRRVMEIPALRLLGKYSYAIYVFHYPIHYVASRYVTALVNGADDNWRFARLLVYVAALSATSLIAALISWRLLEKPFLDMKDRFAPRPQSDATDGRALPLTLAPPMEEA
ncbi:MAG TPA: acyltransferase [Gemmatimonadaceae bacterium]|nr:acyltransferase [Gemmatimonadaceae bacterium]